MTDNHSYHEGELAVQKRVNRLDMARMAGRMISNSIPAGALQFIEQQVMVVIGSLKDDGNVWCSIVFGNPGFVRAQDVNTIDIDMRHAGLADDDPLWSNITSNQSVGMLFIELASRRRLRINGQMNKKTMHQFVLSIDQAYPNCPKYIQRRQIKKVQKFNSPIEIKPALTGAHLTEEQKTLICQADTFFVASAYADKENHYSVDASHRGGHPGFINFTDEQKLRIPDYQGNNMFNTLGNFQCYPHAGIIFIDFFRGRLLQLSGIPKIIWQHDIQTDGAQHYWQFEIKHWRESTIPIDINWALLDASPFNPEP